MDNNKLSTRKSVMYYMDKNDKKTYYNSYSLEPNMFAEDLASYLVPYSSLKKNLDIKLIGDGADIATTAFIQKMHCYSDDLEDSIREFVNRIATSVLLYGDVFYEIVFYKDKDEDNFSSFSFEEIKFESVSMRGRNIVFKIPVSVACDKNISRKIIIPKNKILKFSFPNALGGKRFIKRVFYKLSKLSSDEFILLAYKNNYFGFDQTKYYYEHDKYLAESTGVINWNARSLLDKRMTEYFYLHRHIEFNKAQALFLENIIQEINRGLSIVGKEMKFDCKLEINGLEKFKDLEEMRERLEQGTLPFNEVAKI